jgi:hypothetical protein
MKPIYRSIIFFLALGAFETPTLAASQSTKILPIEIQVDLLVEELRKKRAAGDHRGVIEVIAKIRSLDSPFPNFLLWIEAHALNEIGEVLAARDRLLTYINSTGTEGRFYRQAKELLVAIAPRAEQLELELEAEVQKRLEASRLAQEKASILRTQEAQRILDQLGFKIPASGKLDKPTQEAIAVYQVRHDLTINGLINDEVIDLLRTEVPATHTCDQLAHYSTGADDWGTILLSRMDTPNAISECSDALRFYPEVVRFQIQYARSLAAAKRGNDALPIVADLARKGYPAAEFLIGQLHSSGQLQDSGKPDYDNAIPFFRSAAERNYARAQHHMATLLESGEGFSRDLNAALNWYVKAATQGYLPSQFGAARMYYAGRGVKRDYAGALDWYKRASDQGSTEALFKVADMYERGRGTPRDKKQALEWYTRAAAQGHPDAPAKVKRLSR